MPNVFDPTIPNNPPQGIQAQLDLLYLYNPDVANKLIEQLEEQIKEVQANLDYNKLVNKPTLDTTSTNALAAGTEEVAGEVKLHKVSKTGSYEDLNNKPDLDLYATKTALDAGLETKADLAEVNTIRTDLNDLGDQVHEIEAKVPAGATADNQLADKAFVNSSINAVAAYYITSTPEGDSFNTKADLDNGPYYFQGAVRVPTINDYALVKADETHDGAAARYMYDGKQWAYQYTLNDTPFTQAQVDAINSGITAGLVSKYNAAADTVDALDSEVGTLKTEMATAQSDIGELKTASNTQAGLISDLQNDKADKTALPQNQTGTAGQVYTKTDDGAEWKDASGGTSEIVHDATLSGSGTVESPLKVADDTYLPLSGGALTGPLVSSKNVPSFKTTPVLSLCAKKEDGTNGNIATISMTPNVNTLFLDSMLSLNTIITPNVGSGAEKVSLAYIAKINNGSDLAVPTEGGTLARVEDINAAVGDIASVLDSINGESV